MQDKSIVYTKEEIDTTIETKLKPLTNVSNETKDKHVEDIEKKYKNNCSS